MTHDYNLQLGSEINPKLTGAQSVAQFRDSSTPLKQEEG